jgi:flagellar biosynthetic protein FliR
VASDSLIFLDLPLILPVLALVLARVTGLFVTAPLLSSPAIPLRVKVYLSLGVSLVVVPNMLSIRPAVSGWADLLVGIGAELALGAVFGFVLSLMFAGLQLGAHVVAQQAGLAMAQVLNPGFDTETDVLGNLYYWVAAIAFLAAGGHRMLVQSVLESFAALPPMGYSWPDSASTLVVQAFGVVFDLAIRVAWPVLLALLLSELAMGFMGRVLPQFNILVVGFPLRLLVGMMLVCVTITAAVAVSVRVGGDLLEAIRDAVGGVVHAG